MIAITASAIVADLYASQSCSDGPLSILDSTPLKTIHNVQLHKYFESYNLCSSTREHVINTENVI